MRGLLGDILSAEAEVTVVDMEAGLEHLSRSGGTLRHVDRLLLVVEPYVKAIETARRSLVLARDLNIPAIGVLANKVREPEELVLIEQFSADHGVGLVGPIPYDEAVRLADRDGRPAITAAPDSPMVHAIAALADSLEGAWEQPLPR